MNHKFTFILTIASSLWMTDVQSAIINASAYTEASTCSSSRSESINDGGSYTRKYSVAENNGTYTETLEPLDGDLWRVESTLRECVSTTEGNSIYSAASAAVDLASTKVRLQSQLNPNAGFTGGGHLRSSGNAKIIERIYFDSADAASNLIFHTNIEGVIGGAGEANYTLQVRGRNGYIIDSFTGRETLPYTGENSQFDRLVFNRLDSNVVNIAPGTEFVDFTLDIRARALLAGGDHMSFVDMMNSSWLNISFEDGRSFSTEQGILLTSPIPNIGEAVAVSEPATAPVLILALYLMLVRRKSLVNTCE